MRAQKSFLVSVICLSLGFMTAGSLARAATGAFPTVGSRPMMECLEPGIRLASAAGSWVLGGEIHWRPPSIDELKTIVDYSRYGPAVDPLFNASTSTFYWSSTPEATWSWSWIWAAGFDEGFSWPGYWRNDWNRLLVWCVRGGF